MISLKRKERIVIVVITLVVFCLLFGIYSFLLHKSATYARANVEFSAISAPLNDSTVLTSPLKDDGCKTEEEGFGSRNVCYYRGFIYYKATGNLSEKLGTIDSTLRKQGWMRTDSDFNNSLDQLNNNTDISTKFFWVIYEKQNDLLTVKATYQKEAIKEFELDGQYSKTGELSTLKDIFKNSNDYVYGFTLVSYYVSLSHPY